MSTTAKTLLFDNSAFRLDFENGFITSLRPAASAYGKCDTEFVYPGMAFGTFEAVAETTDGTVGSAFKAVGEPEFSASMQQKKAVINYESENFPLKAVSVYTLTDKKCLWSLELCNTSDSCVTVTDLALPFPCNTKFDWGVSASDKVLGHHFVAGHGSHLLFERCDGFGPVLIAYPADSTAFEYYGMVGGDQNVKHAFCAYIHSKNARREAVEMGAKPRYEASCRQLKPGEKAVYNIEFCWAQDNNDARRKFVENGLVDIQVLPGMTVPCDHKISLAADTKWPDVKLTFPCGKEIPPVKCDGTKHYYSFTLTQLGENTLWLTDSRGYKTNLDFFVTEPLETLIRKRGRFIASHQHNDESLWYNGLLAEWNNETAVMLGPDNYDKIKGWRIYEVSCDDPGLSKPAFLSGKLAEMPDDAEIAAMDRYVENFVWGGLQCTEEEPYPYAIYGIPDWKTNRESEDDGLRGKLHIWRIYDYPHIFMMYYNLYRVKKQYAAAPLTHDSLTYLKRAYRTAVAMFTVPLEIEGWSAFETGLYNEYAIEGILKALETEGMMFEKARLERLWDRKVYQFTEKNADIFGSEYPFDTTGFESTHVLANRALKQAVNEKITSPWDNRIQSRNAVKFMENQHKSNVSCRGVLEPAYYWYGSDYRGNNVHYTLSYMSQMGGWSILDYALYHAADPFEFLRLGYGSLMSSWALMNTGTAETNYGYYFPGKEHDGAASGGFEPLFLGETWLQQPHHFGPWYYSCEIDLGFCGYLHGASTILADDPLFGMTCLGGKAENDGSKWTVHLNDGVNRRFHYVDKEKRVHITTDVGRLEKVEIDTENGKAAVIINLDGNSCNATVTLEKSGYGNDKAVTITADGTQTVVFE
ncbi:MAG: hypothetical protein E7484_05880 [Ruminococcaceae bacterium]|nr:hypothetical protein [Oscillospiraceae bacterium]